MTTGRHNEGIWSLAVCPNSVATTKLKYKTSLNPFEIPFLNNFLIYKITSQEFNKSTWFIDYA